LPFPQKITRHPHRGSSSTRPAETAELHCVAVGGKAEAAPKTVRGPRDPRSFGLDHRAAVPVDEQLAGMRVIWHRTIDKALGAFGAMHQTKFGQEIEATVDAGGSCRGNFRTKRLENFIGYQRTFRGEYRHQDISAQAGQAGARTPTNLLSRLLCSCLIVRTGYSHTRFLCCRLSSAPDRAGYRMPASADVAEHPSRFQRR
jgi:hypothetical protein